MPEQIFVLYEGKARFLGFDPRTEMPTTLELLQPGAVFGWVDWVRGVPCETAIASTETICLALERGEFERILEQQPQLQAIFRDRSALIEVFDLLGRHLEQQARGEGELKEVAAALLEDIQVHHLYSGNDFDHDGLAAGREWLVSGGGAINYPVGSRFNPVEPPQFANGKPLRLIGLPANWVTHLAPESDRTTMLPLNEGESRAVEVEVLPPVAGTGEIPYADVQLQGKKIRKEAAVAKLETKYPHVAGKGVMEASVACFQMLSQYFGMPFRRDVIRRIVGDQLQHGDGLSLSLCGAIVELMGLSAQLVKVPAAAISQLQAPALVRWQDSLAILYEISESHLTIGVPELGILRRPIADFTDTWGESGEVLLLQKTKETPQQRFGLSWFLPSVIKYRGVLIQVLVASFFVQLFGLANPLMVQVIIDKVIVQNSADTLHVLGVFLVIIAIFEALLSTLRTYLFVDTTNRIDMSLGSEIIDHLLRLPLRYFERRPVGEISTRINELENIRQFLTGTALTVVLDSVFSVVYIVVMFVYSPLLTFVALGIIPLFVVMTLIFSPVIRRQLRAKAERNAETQSLLVEVMTGIQTVKAQNIELRSRWQWQERYARYVSAGFNTVVTSTLAGSTSNFLNKLSGLLVLWVGAYLVLEHKLSLGQLIAFRIIAGYVTSPILRLTQLWQNFQETALSLERLADIVDTPQEVEQDRNNIPMPLIQGAVKYDNVCFRFKPYGPLNLYNVNLEFPAGTFVAVVGPSGAGKSTLTKLLCRLYEPESGRILIDGYDINKVELYSLRRQVGVVPQETLLFEGTVQENIALTNPDATVEEIIEAAKVVAAHEFIMSLPNGYNTRVGERGSALSGGQRQRIAIARSVLQQPRMLVLDEATSALDYATEQQVCINLLSAFRDRTVFFITHRLGSVKNADVIVVMDGGAVVEQGTHEELMALKGRYFYLYHQQEAKL
jgi:ATP-binding cassette subfamily B protein